MADFVAQNQPASVISAVADTTQVSIVSAGVAAIYAQRVWSTGLGVWCYYTTPLNETPASSITTPNWTGTAIDYNVVSRRLN